MKIDIQDNYNIYAFDGVMFVMFITLLFIGNYQIIKSLKENNIFTLQNFKGKNLFINYWATWCNPCLAEMPYMAELYENYKDEEDIIFLYLSREKLETIKNYIPKDESLQQLPIYKIITDDEFFATSGIPTTFIVNSDGEVIVKDLGSAFWNDESVFKFIDNLIGKNEI